jgi:hypothetical protein
MFSKKNAFYVSNPFPCSNIKRRKTKSRKQSYSSSVKKFGFLFCISCPLYPSHCLSSSASLRIHRHGGLSSFRCCRSDANAVRGSGGGGLGLSSRSGGSGAGSCCLGSRGRGAVSSPSSGALPARDRYVLHGDEVRVPGRGVVAVVGTLLCWIFFWRLRKRDQEVEFLFSSSSSPA